MAVAQMYKTVVMIRRDASQPWAPEQQPLRYVGTETLGSRVTTHHHCGTSESIAHEVSRPMPPGSHVVCFFNGIFSMSLLFHSFWMFFFFPHFFGGSFFLRRFLNTELAPGSLTCKRP